MELPPFLDQLVDWRDFEWFVRDMYAHDPSLTVEHNVEEKGLSGAKRQTDVKFTHCVQGITYTTLVECKKWKDKVSRDRIDVLASSVDDLKASKGVMFTTTGYEPGAEEYAKAKDIDLFVVRDLTDDEWGAPGRLVTFWMQYFNGHFDRLDTKSMLLSFRPGIAMPKLDFTFGPDGQLDEKLTLVSRDMKLRGPNLSSVLLDARNAILKLVSDGLGQNLIPGGKLAMRAVRVPMEIVLSQSPTHSLVVDGGRLDIESLSGDLLVTIKQDRFEHDRGQHVDLALAVEHFMTRQRQVVVRGKREGTLAVYEVPDVQRETPDDIVTPNTLLRIFLEAWVNPDPLTMSVEQGNRVRFELPADGSREWRTTISAARPEASAGS